MTENSEEKLSFLLSSYQNLLPTWPYSKSSIATAPSSKEFSHPNLSKCFPLFFHWLIVLESLLSLTISVTSCCPCGSMKLYLIAFLITECHWAELGHGAQGTRMTGAGSFPRECWLSPSLCPPQTKKSLLTLETRQSWAAGVRAKECYSSCHILYNTLFFNLAVRLRSSAQWVT